MVSSFLRFRTDLCVSRQTNAGNLVFVVKDPVYRQFYRLPEEAHFITCQLDGATSLETVQRRTEEHFNTSLPRESLQAFVGYLRQAKLLAVDGLESQPRNSRRLAGNLLNLRFRWFDPDQLFNRLVHPLRFLFTPQFLCVSAATIMIAALVIFTQWEDVTSGLSGAYRLANLPLVTLVIFLVITAHEFAHGLTCKHFGGEVHEMGFLLIYFQPAMFCNVSDAWMFPEKAKRLWVGFAGPYFELFLWAIATLVWRVTDVEATINQVGYIVMTSSGVKTLLNFNPLIKLDGYYLASDWLEIANMRRRSFALLGNYLKRMFGVPAPDSNHIPQRERRICLVYGVVAVAGSFAVLAFAFATFGRLLVDQQQPLALALFTGLLGLKVRRRFRRLFSGSNANVDDPDDTLPTDSSTTPETTPNSTAISQSQPAGSVEPAAPPPGDGDKLSKSRKRAAARFWRFTRLLLLVGGVTALLFMGSTELRIGGPFDVMPLHNADVRAGIEGIVDEICVEEGAVVRRGELIARLVDRDVRADLQRINAQLDETRSRLKLLEAGSRPEEIQLAETVVTRATDQLKFARDRLERDRILYEDKLVSLNEYEDSKRQVSGLQSDLAEAAKRLDLLLAGSRPEEIDAMRSALMSLDAQRHYLEEQLGLMRVVSPASGIVATPARQLEEMKHQLVKRGDLIAKVFHLETITAEIAVSERDIADIKVGQRVVLKVRAYPDMTFSGKVTFIATSAQISTTASSSAVAQAQNGGSSTLTRSAVAPKTIIITSEIDNPSLLLKPEMTGQAKVICDRQRFIDLFTRRIARTIKVEFWSWW